MRESPRTQGFYVDIGCHGPKRGNNTYWLYERGWSGILVDVEDEKVMSCKFARPRDTAVKIAVTDYEGQVTVYADKAFSTTATIIGPSGRHAGKNSYSRDVPATTLSKLLTVLGAPLKFELLSIDTEGSDLKVLRGLDFTIYQPTYICVEEFYKDSVLDLETSEVNKLLVRNGYRLVSVAGFSLIYKSNNASTNR